MRVMVFGTFDLLHPGHESLIRQAMSRGDVTVIVARDENVLRIKGRNPHQTERKRVDALRAAFPAATVRLGDRVDFLRPVCDLKPDLLLLGYDQALPPGVIEQDLGVRIERARAFRPEQFKSSLRR